MVTKNERKTQIVTKKWNARQAGWLARKKKKKKQWTNHVNQAESSNKRKLPYSLLSFSLSLCPSPRTSLRLSLVLSIFHSYFLRYVSYAVHVLLRVLCCRRRQCSFLPREQGGWHTMRVHRIFLRRTQYAHHYFGFENVHSFSLPSDSSLFVFCCILFCFFCCCYVRRSLVWNHSKLYVVHVQIHIKNTNVMPSTVLYTIQNQEHARF